jgi:uncharacterized protein YxjI
MAENTDHDFLIRRKVFKLLGAAFHVYSNQGKLLAYSKMKAFKLKEDIRLYDSEAMTRELLRISARNIIDFSATYDIFDSISNTKIGAMRRKGLKSILMDEWLVLDSEDREIGQIKEDSMLLALIRRFLTNLIPQSYEGTVNGKHAVTYKQNFNPFVRKIKVLLRDWPAGIDPRLAMVGGILLSAIEGRQN